MNKFNSIQLKKTTKKQKKNTGHERCVTVNFASSLCIRKKSFSVITYLLFFHSGASTMTCYNTYSLLWQWNTVSLGIPFQPVAIVNFVFTKIAEMCNERATCACDCVYN